MINPVSMTTVLSVMAIPMPAFRAGESGGSSDEEGAEGEGRDVDIEERAVVNGLTLISKIYFLVGN